MTDDIRNVSPEELAQRKAAADETIAKAKEKWDRMVRARKPLGPHEGMRELEAGLRDRVSTSIFGQGWPVRDYRLMLPCFRDIPPLHDHVVAALITFWNRRAQAQEIQAFRTYEKVWMDETGNEEPFQ